MRSRRTSCKIDAMARQRGLAQITLVCDPVAKTQVGCAFACLLGSAPHNHTNRYGAQDLGHIPRLLIHHHRLAVVTKASNKKYLRAPSFFRLLAMV